MNDEECCFDKESHVLEELVHPDLDGRWRSR